MIGIVRDNYPLSEYLYSKSDHIANWLSQILRRNNIDPDRVINVDISDLRKDSKDYKLFTVFYKK